MNSRKRRRLRDTCRTMAKDMQRSGSTVDDLRFCGQWSEEDRAAMREYLTRYLAREDTPKDKP